MTAQHVIAHGREFRSRFDYVVSPLGQISTGTLVEVANGNWLLGHSPPDGDPPIEGLHTALFRLAEPVGWLGRTDGQTYAGGSI